MSEFKVNHRGTGDRQFPPHMMLALLIYSYANGVFSSRKIEQSTHRDVVMRYLSADTHPDHDTICTFRRNNFQAFSAAFVDVLELAVELKVLKLGNISLDGTHIKANASINQNVTYQRACEIREQLKLDIDELLAEAEAADRDEEQAEKLPKEIARREKLAAKMDQACAELEARAKRRDEKARAEFDQKMAERQAREKATGKKSGGPKAKPPKSGPEHSNQQVNLTDADSRIMRKNKRSSFTQSYNAQAAVDADGSQLIMGEHVSQSPSDSDELEKGVRSVPESIGKPGAVAVDAGYVNGDAFERIENELGVEVYCSVHREDAHSERNYDYRPNEQSQRPTKTIKDPRLVAMGEKLRTAEGKAIYAKRNHTVETAFGIIKSVLGFREFSLRGLEKVGGEWTLICLAYNMKLLHRLKHQSETENALFSRALRAITMRWLDFRWVGGLLGCIKPRILRGA
jgi:transposase